jgi:hypothetical protein
MPDQVGGCWYCFVEAELIQTCPACHLEACAACLPLGAKYCVACASMMTYEITLVIETSEGDPEKWNWTDLVGDHVAVKDCVDKGPLHT